MILSFSQYFSRQSLDEKLITFGGRAYPPFGQVVIMAGGAGSGKGFVKDKLLGVEGFVFDVDALKTLAQKTPALVKKIKDEFGDDISTMNLKVPENVSRLHEIIGDALKLDDRKLQIVYTSILTASPERKPNIIFDVTLKDLRKLEKISRQVRSLGYNSDNIHIVWVVNDVNIAIDQNAKRSRTVPVEILVNTHRGVSSTMQDILNMGKEISNYMNGEIVVAFNKVGVDSELVKSGRGGSYVKEANYFRVKQAGKPPLSVNQISDDLRKKIQSYVPPGADWA